MKIGILDSGIGGFITSKKLIENSTHSFVVLMDFKNLPYGTGKTKEELLNILKINLNTLFYEYFCDKVILVCNTISSVYLEFKNEIDELYGPEKIIDIVTLTKNYIGTNKVNLIATSYTVNSGIYDDISNKKIAKDEWVQLAENYVANKESLFNFEIPNAIFDMSNNIILLGCTHFSLFEDIFKMSGLNVIFQSEIIKNINLETTEKPTHLDKKSLIIVYTTNGENHSHKILQLLHTLNLDKISSLQIKVK